MQTPTHRVAMLKQGVAAAALSAALLSSPAFAQDNEGGDEVIIVTGSRIAAPNLTSVAPITTVTAEDIKLTGTNKTEDLLNSLPQVFASQSSTVSNGATGTATVDLRGLGAERTLVLINGRRLIPGDPGSSAADLNFIPTSLVKRVEVLTGGASATYGADAVAGVVNFIMDRDYEGFRVDGNYSFYQHKNRNKTLPPLLDRRANQGFAGFEYPKGSSSDGEQFDTTVSFGGKFNEDRGHFSAYVGYRKVNELIQRNRDYSACVLQNTTSFATQGLQCGGSATSATGTVFYFVESYPSSSTVGALGPNTLTQGTLNRYNFAPLNHYQRPDERYTAGAFIDYEINDAIKPYMEFMFMDDRTVAQIAPSGNFGNTYTINCDNPLLSAEQAGQLCAPANLIVGYLGTYPMVPGMYEAINGEAAPAPLEFFDPVTGNTYNRAYMNLLRRNVEGGPRRNDLQHTSYRAVIGSKGELDKAWSYDAYYQYGRTNYSQVYTNELSVSRLINALDVVEGPNGPACRATLAGADPNCVPWDIFTGNPISDASLNYVAGAGLQKGQTSQQVLSLMFTGLLGEYGMKLPWANDGISVPIGGEYRKESLELNPDTAFQTGDLTGQGAPTLPISGNYKVTEFISEVEVPIITDGAIKNLSFNTGYRYSHYKISNGKTFNTDTYKFGVDFTPISDIRLRGAYNRAVRAPNVQELFAPQIVALDGTTDACAGFTITADDLGCLAQGLRVGQKVTANPAAQYNGLIGGNPNLRPEKATTKTFGVVLQPRMIPSLSLSVDYFDIKVKDAIQGYGADAIGNACANDNNPVACALIVRNPAGSLWLSSEGYVIDLAQNVGGVHTRGVEVNANYTQDIGKFGSLNFNLIGTMLDKYEVDNGLTEVYDCAGYFGPTCGTPAPKWRHKARLSWEPNKSITVSAQWRYFAKVDLEYKNPSSTLNGAYYDFGSRIGSQSYFDLAGSWQIIDNLVWRLGVNNILDRQPPLVPSGSALGYSACASTVCNGNTYPGTYDSLGRYVYTGVTVDF